MLAEVKFFSPRGATQSGVSGSVTARRAPGPLASAQSFVFLSNACCCTGDGSKVQTYAVVDDASDVSQLNVQV